VTLQASIDFDALAETYAWPSADNAHQTHVRLNMAIRVDGGFVDAEGKSKGVSSSEDRRLLKIIRSGAQAILVGANTIRAEGWNLPETGMLFVLTRTEDLPWETCPDRNRVRTISGMTSPQQILQIIREAGGHNILIEGGGSVARQFAAKNLFDDVCLTVQLETESSATETTLKGALTGLLDVSPLSYDLISRVSVVRPPSVFTLWRRAIDSPPSAAY